MRVGILCAAIGALACVSTREIRSGPLSPVEPLPVTVGVMAGSNYEAEELVSDLASTGLFREVELVDTESRAAQLIATRLPAPIREEYACDSTSSAEIAVISFLTLTLLPAHTCELGYSVRFEAVRSREALDFAFEYRSDVYVGPYFLPMNLAEGWHWGFPSDEARRAALTAQLREMLPTLSTLAATGVKARAAQEDSTPRVH